MAATTQGHQRVKYFLEAHNGPVRVLNLELLPQHRDVLPELVRLVPNTASTFKVVARDPSGTHAVSRVYSTESEFYRSIAEEIDTPRSNG